MGILLYSYHIFCARYAFAVEGLERLAGFFFYQIYLQIVP